MNNPKKPTGKKSNNVYLILVGVFLMLLSAFLIFLYGKKATQQKSNKPEPAEELEPETEPETEPEAERKDYANDLVELFVEKGLSEKEARFWISVSAHETAGFTSPVYNENNNLFGMKQPEERKTTSLGQKGNYASYENDEDSIKDIMLWIEARQFPKEHGTIRQLTSDMKNKGYFEAPYLEYTNAVLKWHKQLFKS